MLNRLSFFSKVAVTTLALSDKVLAQTSRLEDPEHDLGLQLKVGFYALTVFSVMCCIKCCCRPSTPIFNNDSDDEIEEVDYKLLEEGRYQRSTR